MTVEVLPPPSVKRLRLIKGEEIPLFNPIPVKTAAEELGHERSTLYRWNRQLKKYCRDYLEFQISLKRKLKESGISAPSGFNPYQYYCLRLISLWRRANPSSTSKVEFFIASNLDLFTFEAFRANEINEIKEAS